MLENLRGTVFLTGTFLFTDVHSLSFLSSDERRTDITTAKNIL